MNDPVLIAEINHDHANIKAEKEFDMMREVLTGQIDAHADTVAKDAITVMELMEDLIIGYDSSTMMHFYQAIKGNKAEQDNFFESLREVIRNHAAEEMGINE